jgi:flavin reductase
MSEAAPAEKLKRAMRSLPSGVAIITVRDPETDKPFGMAISSMISVSMDPPTMLAAINRNSANHEVFARAERFCINLLSVDHRNEVALFASGQRREERFGSEGWIEVDGVYCLADATAIVCAKHDSMIVGTHEIFVGEVLDVRHEMQARPLGWLNGGFHDLAPLALAEAAQ